MEGSRAPPPMNHYSLATGEGSIYPNRQRTIGEILASEGYGNSYYDDPFSGDSYYDEPYHGYVCNELTVNHVYNPNAGWYEELKDMMASYMDKLNYMLDDLRFEWEETTEYLHACCEGLSLRMRILQKDLDKQEDERIKSMVTEVPESLKPKEEEEHALPIPEVCKVLEDQNHTPMELSNEIKNFKEVPHIDFIFPSNAFDPPVHSAIKLYFLIMFPNIAVNFIAKYMACLPWTLVFFLAHMIHSVNRRRTKGPLAQPFDSCD